jgi:hypothetical protein
MLNIKLPTCQQVATLASDYLYQQADGKITFKIRVHLMMCANCRRFVKHLRLTKAVVPQLIDGKYPDVDVEAILKRIKERS